MRRASAHSEHISFGAQYPAHSRRYRRFTDTLTGIAARLAVNRGSAHPSFQGLSPLPLRQLAWRTLILIVAPQLRAAKLHVVSGVPQADIMAAFHLSRPTVARAVKRYRERGEDAFFEPRRGRGRTVVDARMAVEAAKLLASGISGSACARQLGIPVSTFNENQRAGVIADPTRAPAAVADAPQAVAATDHPASADARQTDPPPATDRATRDARDKHAPMGRAARDVEGRMLASAGLMTEAEPVFAAPAHAVAHGGVLAALPMLLRAGLLGAANRLFRLPDGFYGLTTILLFVAFMTLARVRNPDSLRYQAPGEWGAILGLDRCPETKTLRRKIRLLTSAEHTVRDWQSALARTWATEHDDDWATLAVDGHVKVYAGRNGRLPKHFVARQSKYSVYRCGSSGHNRNGVLRNEVWEDSGEVRMGARRHAGAR